MRIEAKAHVGSKWQKRAARMVVALDQAVGGKSLPGLFMFLKKAVRADYVNKSLGQIARDKPCGLTLFYKSLPVNLEAWIRSLCEYNVDTYVPRWWGLRHSRCQETSRRAVVARLGICNNVPKAEAALVDFATCAWHHGLSVERISVAVASTSCRYDAPARKCAPVTHFLSGRDYFNLNNSKEVALCTSIQVRPTQSLEYDEIIGLLERGGRFASIGTRHKVLFTFLIESDGDVFRSYSGPRASHYLQEHIEACAHLPLWNLEVHSAAFPLGDPLNGADALVTLTKGLQLETLVLVGAVCTSDERHTIMNALSKAALEEILAAARPNKTRLPSHTGDLATHLCIAVTSAKRKTIADSQSPAEAPLEWTGVAFGAAEVTNPPKKCRNGWVLACGSTVQAMDVIVNKSLHGRARWPTDETLCRACPAPHPDPHVRQQGRCGSHFCKSLFWMADTFTHYNFKGNRGKRVEVDKNNPLFTDNALRELEQKTTFKFSL